MGRLNTQAMIGHIARKTGNPWGAAVGETEPLLTIQRKFDQFWAFFSNVPWKNKKLSKTVPSGGTVTIAVTDDVTMTVQKNIAIYGDDDQPVSFRSSTVFRAEALAYENLGLSGDECQIWTYVDSTETDGEVALTLEFAPKPVSTKDVYIIAERQPKAIASGVGNYLDLPYELEPTFIDFAIAAIMKDFNQRGWVDDYKVAMEAIQAAGGEIGEPIPA